jgi:hypothetical protein
LASDCPATLEELGTADHAKLMGANSTSSIMTPANL